MPIIIPSSAASSSNVANIVKKVRQEIVEEAPFLIRVNAYTAAGTTVTTTTSADAASLGEGDWFEWDDATSDQARVTSAQNGSNPVPISISYRGTDNNSHSAGYIRVKPRYSFDKISRTIAEVITADLWPWVWTTGTKDVTILSSPTSAFYEVPADYEDCLLAYQKGATTITDITTYRPGVNFGEYHNLDSSISSTGKAIRITTGEYNTTNPLHLFYRAKITSTTIPAGDVEDLLTYLTCSRLAAGKEYRVAADDQAPSETVVQPGAFARTAAWYLSRSLELRRRINLRLQTDQPVPKKWLQTWAVYS